MKIAESSPKQVENTVGKGEIARYKQFLLFPHCFQKTCTKNQDLFEEGLKWRETLIQPTNQPKGSIFLEST